MTSVVFGTHSFDDVPSVGSSLFLLNGGNTPVILSDIMANRPSPGLTGRLFVDQTGNMIYRDTGSGWVALIKGMTILSKSANPVSVTPTAETNAVNFVVPGGTLGTNGYIRLQAGGFLSHNTAATTTTIRIRVYYGTTVLYDDTSIGFASGSLVPFNMDLYLGSGGSETAQFLSGCLALGTSAGATTGTGDLGTDEISALTPIYGSSAVSSNVNQNLRVTMTLSAGAAATTIFTMYYHVAELG
jgi:hypothetical protein